MASPDGVKVSRTSDVKSVPGYRVGPVRYGVRLALAEDSSSTSFASSGGSNGGPQVGEGCARVKGGAGGRSSSGSLGPPMGRGGGRGVLAGSGSVDQGGADSHDEGDGISRPDGSGRGGDSGEEQEPLSRARSDSSPGRLTGGSPGRAKDTEGRVLLPHNPRSSPSSPTPSAPPPPSEVTQRDASKVFVGVPTSPLGFRRFLPPSPRPSVRRSFNASPRPWISSTASPESFDSARFPRSSSPSAFPADGARPQEHLSAGAQRFSAGSTDGTRVSSPPPNPPKVPAVPTDGTSLQCGTRCHVGATSTSPPLNLSSHTSSLPDHLACTPSPPPHQPPSSPPPPPPTSIASKPTTVIYNFIRKASLPHVLPLTTAVPVITSASAYTTTADAAKAAGARTPLPVTTAATTTTTTTTTAAGVVSAGASVKTKFREGPKPWLPEQVRYRSEAKFLFHPPPDHAPSARHTLPPLPTTASPQDLHPPAQSLSRHAATYGLPVTPASSRPPASPLTGTSGAHHHHYHHHRRRHSAHDSTSSSLSSLPHRDLFSHSTQAFLNLPSSRSSGTVKDTRVASVQDCETEASSWQSPDGSAPPLPESDPPVVESTLPPFDDPAFAFTFKDFVPVDAPWQESKKENSVEGGQVGREEVSALSCRRGLGVLSLTSNSSVSDDAEEGLQSSIGSESSNGDVNNIGRCSEEGETEKGGGKGRDDIDDDAVTSGDGPNDSERKSEGNRVVVEEVLGLEEDPPTSKYTYSVAGRSPRAPMPRHVTMFSYPGRARPTILEEEEEEEGQQQQQQEEDQTAKMTISTPGTSVGCSASSPLLNLEFNIIGNANAHEQNPRASPSTQAVGTGGSGREDRGAPLVALENTHTSSQPHGQSDLWPPRDATQDRVAGEREVPALDDEAAEPKSPEEGREKRDRFLGRRQVRVRPEIPNKLTKRRGSVPQETRRSEEGGSGRSRASSGCADSCPRGRLTPDANSYHFPQEEYLKEPREATSGGGNEEVGGGGGGGGGRGGGVLAGQTGAEQSSSSGGGGPCQEARCDAHSPSTHAADPSHPSLTHTPSPTHTDHLPPSHNRARSRLSANTSGLGGSRKEGARGPPPTRPARSRPATLGRLREMTKRLQTPSPDKAVRAGSAPPTTPLPAASSEEARSKPHERTDGHAPLTQQQSLPSSIGQPKKTAAPPKARGVPPIPPTDHKHHGEEQQQQQREVRPALSTTTNSRTTIISPRNIPYRSASISKMDMDSDGSPYLRKSKSPLTISPVFHVFKEYPNTFPRKKPTDKESNTSVSSNSTSGAVRSSGETPTIDRGCGVGGGGGGSVGGVGVSPYLPPLGAATSVTDVALLTAHTLSFKEGDKGLLGDMKSKSESELCGPEEQQLPGRQEPSIDQIKENLLALKDDIESCSNNKADVSKRLTPPADEGPKDPVRCEESSSAAPRTQEEPQRANRDTNAETQVEGYTGADKKQPAGEPSKVSCAEPETGEVGSREVSTSSVCTKDVTKEEKRVANSQTGQDGCNQMQQVENVDQNACDTKRRGSNNHSDDALGKVEVECQMGAKESANEKAVGSGEEVGGNDEQLQPAGEEVVIEVGEGSATHEKIEDRAGAILVEDRTAKEVVDAAGVGEGGKKAVSLNLEKVSKLRDDELSSQEEVLGSPLISPSLMEALLGPVSEERALGSFVPEVTTEAQSKTILESTREVVIAGGIGHQAKRDFESRGPHEFSENESWDRTPLSQSAAKVASSKTTPCHDKGPSQLECQIVRTEAKLSQCLVIKSGRSDGEGRGEEGQEGGDPLAGPASAECRVVGCRPRLLSRNDSEGESRERDDSLMSGHPPRLGRQLSEDEGRPRDSSDSSSQDSVGIFHERPHEGSSAGVSEGVVVVVGHEAPGGREQVGHEQLQSNQSHEQQQQQQHQHSSGSRRRRKASEEAQERCLTFPPPSKGSSQSDAIGYSSVDSNNLRSLAALGVTGMGTTREEEQSLVPSVDSLENNKEIPAGEGDLPKKLIVTEPRPVDRIERKKKHHSDPSCERRGSSDALLYLSDPHLGEVSGVSDPPEVEVEDPGGSVGGKGVVSQASTDSEGKGEERCLEGSTLGPELRLLTPQLTFGGNDSDGSTHEPLLFDYHRHPPRNVSPSPYLQDSDSGERSVPRSPHQLRRYSKRPLRGPLGKIIEAEMNKSKTNSSYLVDLPEDFFLRVRDAKSASPRPSSPTTPSAGPMDMPPPPPGGGNGTRPVLLLPTSRSLDDSSITINYSTAPDRPARRKLTSSGSGGPVPSTGTMNTYESDGEGTLSPLPHIGPLHQRTASSPSKLFSEGGFTSEEETEIIDISLLSATVLGPRHEELPADHRHPPEHRLTPELRHSHKRHRDTRTHVIGELYDTERNYVNNLNFLLTRYLQPLKSAENSSIIDPGLVDDIFFQVPEIRGHHDRFLQELKGRLDNWDASNGVGDVFIHTFSDSSVVESYTSFTNNWKTAKETAKAAAQSKLSFRDFLSAMAKEHPGKLDLKALLIKPIQRIPQYELLIKRLLKHTGRDHPDYPLLTEAMGLVHQVAVRIDAVEQDEQQQQLLKEIENIIEGLDGLVQPDRTFLCHDLVTVNSGLGTRKERCLFLFSDLLVITSIKRRSGTIRKGSSLPSTLLSSLESNKFKVFKFIPLDDLDIARSRDESVKKLLREVEAMEHELDTLHQISKLSKTLRLNQRLEDIVQEMLGGTQKQLAERQGADSQLLELELTITTQEGMENLMLVFSSAEKRAMWEVAFNGAKQKLAMSAHRRPPPEFMSALPIRKTRAGLQFTCAAATLGLNAHNLRDVWVCNSDGYVGQVCVLSLQPDPTVACCNGVCNARILSIASVPAAPHPDSSDDEDDEELPVDHHDDPRKRRSESLPPDMTSQEDTDNQQPTMWLGTEDGFIHVYNCSDTIRIKKNRFKFQPGSPVHCIIHLDNRVFASLANGDLIIYRRDMSGGWNILERQLVSISTAAAPVTRMMAVAGKIWCAAQNTVRVLNTTTLQVEHTLVVAGEASRGVSCMVSAGHGVWIAVHNSANVRLFHAATYECLCDINAAPAVTKMLAGCDDIIRQHKAACLRVTALLACKDLLWIGTSAGVIITVPLPHLAHNTHKVQAPLNMVAIPHGHTGHVRFLTCVELTPEIRPPRLKGHLRYSFKGKDHAHHQQGTAAPSKLLVISGGDGYEDFRSSGQSEVAGRDDSTNHLLLWQV